MAEVTLIPIVDLFGKKFFVPSYQRGYRWSKTQINELLEDLFDFVVTKKSEDDYYCLQPIIVKSKGEKTWELVDGQQRLTALWLISALYYCSHREDVLGLERKKYDLEYEEKENFTNMFVMIENMLDECTLTSLLSKLKDKKDLCIDGRNLIESIENIAKFTRNNKSAKGVLGQIFESIHSVKIIWYVLGDNEDSIQTFTNINANKIELTDAELIKAVLLNATIDEYEENNKALQWEEIEKGLNNNSFWNYMISSKKKYKTRIDYLFEIFCYQKNLVDFEKDNERHFIFKAISKYLSENGSEDFWKEIQGIYEVLKDWYDDYFFYHTIGFLIIADKKKSDAFIIKELYREYSTLEKSKFKESILNKIKELFFSNRKTTPFSVFEIEQIKNDLEELTVQQSNSVRDVLLMYNIALLVNAYNTYERFPFELFKQDTWDIEHINPQTPKESSLEEKKNWLDSYKKVITDESLMAEIKACEDNNYDSFNIVAEEVITKMNIADNDSISNLVLLDSSTNRGYKNECFAEKRKKIIEVERTKCMDEKYIPIGTKWVFLKGYDTATQLVVWGMDDMQEYVEDIADEIYKMLGGK